MAGMVEGRHLIQLSRPATALDAERARESLDVFDRLRAELEELRCVPRVGRYTSASGTARSKSVSDPSRARLANDLDGRQSSFGGISISAVTSMRARAMGVRRLRRVMLLAGILLLWTPVFSRADAGEPDEPRDAELRLGDSRSLSRRIRAEA
jgi:hypothetical protein